MMKPWKLELTPRRMAEGGGHGEHESGIFLEFSPTDDARRGPGLCLRAGGGGGGAAGLAGAGAAPRLVLSTDQLQRRQASVTCDSQCQFHARGNHLRKSWAGFTFDKKSAAFVFAKRRITECDRSQRLPAASTARLESVRDPQVFISNRFPPAAPCKLGRENKLSVSIYSCTSWKYRGF